MSARLSLAIESFLNRFPIPSFFKTGSAISSAHRATAEAATPGCFIPLPAASAIWMAKFPSVVLSLDPSSYFQSSPLRRQTIQ